MSFDIRTTLGIVVKVTLLSSAACLCAAQPSPHPVPSAVIVNSGSTNSAGFRILVDRSANAEFTLLPHRSRPEGEKGEAKPARRKIPEALVRRLYSDLKVAEPLQALPSQRCMKSVSFGSTLTIELGDEQTPDLSCGEAPDARIQALRRDANDIVKLFHVRELGIPAL